MNKIKRIQIQMVIITVLSALTQIISHIDKNWISHSIGYVCQFFYWAYCNIFNGIEHMYTTTEVFNMISSYESFANANPLITLEIIVCLCFSVLAILPTKIIIIRAGNNDFRHFIGVHNALFILSIAVWSAFFLIIFQYLKNCPVVINLSDTCLIVLIHACLYSLLLIYIAINTICKVTKDNLMYEEYQTITLVWKTISRIYLLLLSLTLGIGGLLIIGVILGTSRSAHQKT